MDEYISLGHMSEIPQSDESQVSYYMPHHDVLKSDSVTTKLRVVFDASTPNSNGISLNDLQMAGPAL